MLLTDAFKLIKSNQMEPMLNEVNHFGCMHALGIGMRCWRLGLFPFGACVEVAIVSVI